MLPAVHHFAIYRGDTFRRVIRLRLVDAAGVLGAYADLTGCVPLAQIRENPNSPTILASFTTSVLNQTTDLGAIQIELTAAQTRALPVQSNWDIQLTHPLAAGQTVPDVHTYLAGKVNVSGQVSEPV